MSAIFRRGPAQIEANLTPMIDVTFLLIVFFVLVSQIVRVENVDLTLPSLSEPATVLPGDEQRAVINVVPAGAGRAKEYRLGASTYPADAGGIEQLTARLAAMMNTNPGLRVNLRADRRTQYEAVHPALQAVATAAARVGRDDVAPRVNLVIIRDESR